MICEYSYLSFERWNVPSAHWKMFRGCINVSTTRKATFLVASSSSHYQTTWKVLRADSALLRKSADFWTGFWGVYIFWYSRSDSAKLATETSITKQEAQSFFTNHKTNLVKSIKKLIFHRPNIYSGFIHMSVPFAVDWSPSAWCEGPPRLAHALSAAAASALQPHAYAGEKQREGEDVVRLKDVT